MSHYIERWECGHVASQCRCPGPKEERTRPGKCSTCAAQVSAMPEREVFATESNEQEWLVSYLREAMKMAEKLVPESRLLAAEARVREVEAAFKKYGDHWAQCPAVTPRRKCNCGYDQARAILAREAGE